MATDVSMASNALLLLGEDSISSLSDNPALANLYADTYQSVLAFHPWSFALKEQRLSRNSATPDVLTNYQYSYNLPSDLIRIWEISPFSNYELIGNGLYSNETELLARYVYKVDESQLPPHFVKVMEYKLAADAAMSITEDTERLQIFEQKYMQELNKAMAIDSQSRPQVKIQHSPLTNPYYPSNRFQ